MLYVINMCPAKNMCATLDILKIFSFKLGAQGSQFVKFEKKLKWSVLFQQFIDDGFGIMEGSKTDVEYSIKQCNRLWDTIKQINGLLEMKLNIWTDIYKGNKFYSTGHLDRKIFQIVINRYM